MKSETGMQSWETGGVFCELQTGLVYEIKFGGSRGCTAVSKVETRLRLEGKGWWR